jgi:hypothetical protein
MHSFAPQAAPVNGKVSDPAKSRVRQAQEAVYIAFEMPAPAVIEGCPCCIATRGTDVLLTTPLRQISGEALWRYVSGAYLTIGDDYDFRYLLPRILEVSVSDPGNANNPEIVLGKLSRAGWRSWSHDQQSAVEALVIAWFELALASDIASAEEGWIRDDAESVLCGAAIAGMSLNPFLVRLCEPDAAPVLADLRKRFPREMSGFWDAAPAGLQELRAVLAEGQA